MDGVSFSLGDSFTLNEQARHHLVRVLRLSVNDFFEILVQGDTPHAYLAQFLFTDENKSEAKILKEIALTKTNNVDLIVGLPKPSIADFIVEKSIELNVRNLVFFVASRTQGKLTSEQILSKLSRFQRIQEAALKQSGPQSYVSKIEIYPSLENYLKGHLSGDTDSTLKLICCLAGNSSPQPPKIVDFLSTSRRFRQQSEQLKDNGNYAEISIIVGPEGGLTDEEISLAKTFAYQPASLGEKVMRTETAFIAAGSIASLLG
ncbi:MAG: 16S rRNA (uracil(1498)-N(3))-methyltransferase [Deltaproteobacteria bacterium]|nr:16S rRNA (uracil(1498)-N(3))-methyltransferase [Deltaproteobacteria bacterium]